MADADIQERVKSLLEQIESGDNADDNSPVYVIYTKEEARKITDRIEEKAKKRDSRKSEARLQQSAGHANAKKAQQDIGAMR